MKIKLSVNEFYGNPKGYYIHITFLLKLKSKDILGNLIIRYMGKSGSNFVALYTTIHKFNQSEHAPLTRYAVMYIFLFEFSFKLVSIFGYMYYV